jgi:phospholipase C
MRFIAGFLLLASLAATFAYAQNNISQIQHIIVVVQENRTPDNLFGSDAFAQTRQLPGADLVQSGPCDGPNQIQLQSLALGSSCDPNHGHKLSWIGTYHNGSMNGACNNTTGGNCSPLDYPEYAYAQASDVAPYFQIAQQYGYANYMFQTNQGPSFPAHQFLLSGTSAPTNSGDTSMCTDSKGNSYSCYEWFAAENGPLGSLYGCTATGAMIADVDPVGNEANAYLNGYPCYNHNSLVTLLDKANPKISWKYYAQSKNTATDLWTAPNANYDICMPLDGTQTTCQGPDWKNNVAGVFPNSPNYPNSFSPILTDLGADPHQPQCNLPAVSWVVPDGHWSDHAGLDGWAAGPSWVAAIVNAVGGYYYDASDQQHRTFCQNPDGSAMYWKNTVILVTWDDWGGWYDHVSPAAAAGGPGIGYPNGPNSSSYVYGFRVPLLVVSAYTPKGYISGTCVAPGNCPNETPPYIHDFGSILNFIEYAFGTGGNSLGEISPNYHYADYFAPDGPIVCKANCPHPYSLSDFFPSFTSPRTFTPLTAPFTTECFIVPNKQNCNGENFTGPEDPDADDVDEQD